MPAQAWEKTLRKQIKDNHGFGWNVIVNFIANLEKINWLIGVTEEIKIPARN